MRKKHRKVRSGMALFLIFAMMFSNVTMARAIAAETASSGEPSGGSSSNSDSSKTDSSQGKQDQSKEDKNNQDNNKESDSSSSDSAKPNDSQEPKNSDSDSSGNKSPTKDDQKTPDDNQPANTTDNQQGNSGKEDSNNSNSANDNQSLESDATKPADQEAATDETQNTNPTGQSDQSASNNNQSDEVTASENISPTTDNNATANASSDLAVGKEISLSDDVKITFTKLPETPGKINFKEIKLSSDEMKKTGALSDTLYEITSDMANGTFEYTLTLPAPKNVPKDKMEVKYAHTENDLDNLKSVDNEKMDSGSVTISGLDHFTVFGVFSADSTQTTEPVITDDTVEAPKLSEVAPVPAYSGDNAPLYVFYSSQAGTIAYGGACSSYTSSAISGINFINFTILDDGRHDDCTITVTNNSGQASAPLAVSPFTIDTITPTVGFTNYTMQGNDLVAYGTVSEPTARVSVEIYETPGGDLAFQGDAVNNGNGTWILPAGSINPQLPAGTYEMYIRATDLAQNIGEGEMGYELIVTQTEDLMKVTVDPLTTSITSPALGGTINRTNAAINVTIKNDQGTAVYTGPAVNAGNGTWYLSSGLISPVLAVGVYDVEVTADDLQSNHAVDNTTDELEITNGSDTSVLSHIQMDPTSSYLYVGDVQHFTAQGYDQFGQPINAHYNWYSSDTSVATIDSTGTLTAVGPGSTTVMAASGNISAINTVYVYEASTGVPIIRINFQITNNPNPLITGTINDPDAPIMLIVGGQQIFAINNGDGTWDANLWSDLGDGVYNVFAQATNDQGTGYDTTTNELTIDTVKPHVAIDAPGATYDSSPALSGTTDDPTATIGLQIVSSSTHQMAFSGNAVNNGNNTWILPQGSISPALSPGSYIVNASATDLAGNVSQGLVTTTLVVLTHNAPVLNEVSSVPAWTNDPTPSYTFNSDQPGTIAYSGDCSSATTNATAGDNTITFDALSEGLHDNCALTVTNSEQKTSAPLAITPFTVDLTAPAVTVNNVFTENNSPSLTGTINDPDAAIQVRIFNSQSQMVFGSDEALNNGDGTWTLAAGEINPALTVGTYDVEVTATDQSGNVGTDATTNELVIHEASVLTIINVTPNTATVAIGNTQQFTAETLDQFGNLITANVTWSSSNQSIATISPEGLLTAVAVGSTTVSAVSSDVTGTADVTVRVAPNPPTLSEIMPIGPYTSDQNPMYGFTSDQDGDITYGGDCSSDNTSAFAGDNYVNFNTLSDGLHDNCTITVTNADGDASLPLQVTPFTVDTVSPQLTIVTQVPALTNNPTPDFTFHSTEAGLIQYQGDCSSATTDAVAGDNTITFNQLSDGPHSNCKIYVADSAGNPSNVLEIPPFMVDTIAPTLTEVTPVPQYTNNPTPSYTFNSTEAGAIAYGGSCSSAIADAVVGDNTIAFNQLADGLYDNCTITIADAIGNASAPLNIAPFTVDTIAPVITVNTLTTQNISPELNGTVDDSMAMITVGVGGNTYNAINNGDGTWTLPAGTITPALSSGVYDVAAQATDMAGNAGSDQTTNELTIEAVSVPPILTEVTPVSGITNNPTPSYTFNSDQSGVITYGGDCSSATTDAVAGNNTITFNSLTDGLYNNCTITVTNSSSLASNPLAVSPFTIDTISPALTEVTPVPTITANQTPSYTFNSTEAGNITYGGDCTSAVTSALAGDNIITLDTLPYGLHDNCTITVTDSAGNLSNILNVSPFTIEAPVVNTIAVAPDKATLNSGDTQQFTAQVLDQFGNPIDATLTWNTVDPSIATVDQSGLVTAKTAGQTQITASANGVIGTSDVTVKEVPVLTTITIYPGSISLYIGDTHQFDVQTLDQFGNPISTNLTWTSSNETVGTIDPSTNIFTALAEGMTTLTATDGSVSATAQVIVHLPLPVLTTINVIPFSSSLYVGDTQQFTAQTFDQYGNPITADIAWSTTDPSIITIDQSGLLTAQGSGSAQIEATSGGVIGRADVTVNLPLPVLTTINVTPNPTSLYVGDTQQFTAETLDQYGNPISANLTWSSSDGTIGSIDSTSGMFNALGAGSVTVTATDGTITGTVQVTVNLAPPVLTTINVTPSSVTLLVGDTQQYAVQPLDQYGNPIAVSTPVVWGTSDQTIATIDSNGLLTALASGSVTVYATIDIVTGTATATINLPPPVLNTINVTPSPVTLLVGDTQQFTVQPLDQYGNPIAAAVTWATTDPSIITIDQNGLVTAQGAGQAQVQAISGNIVGTADVTVNLPPPVLTTINVMPGSAALYIGDTQQFTAETLDQYGNPINATITWDSSDPTLGTVDDTGMFTALAPGSVSVTASANGVTGWADAAIQDLPVPTSIYITPDTATLFVGDTQQFTVDVLDQYNNPIETDVTWSVSDPSIAAIDNTGLLTALLPGSVTVTASAGDAIGTADVTVQDLPALTSIVVDPSAVTLVMENTQQFTVQPLDQYGNPIAVDTPVVWGTSDQSIATIDNNGLLTALAPGSVTVFATIGIVTGTADVTVTNHNQGITINSITTDESSPELHGSVDNSNATINVYVNNASYAGTNNGDGTWMLPAGIISSLNPGAYPVKAAATLSDGSEISAYGTLTITQAEEGGHGHHHHHHHHKHHHHHHHHHRKYYYGCDQFFRMYCHSPYDGVCRAMMNYCPTNMSYMGGRYFSYDRNGTDTGHELSLNTDPTDSSGSSGSGLAVANAQTPQVQAAEAIAQGDHQKENQESGSNVGYWIVAVIILLGLAGGIGWTLYRVRP